MKRVITFFLALTTFGFSSYAETYLNCKLDVLSPLPSSRNHVRYTVRLRSYLQKQGTFNTAQFKADVADLNVKVIADLYQWTSVRERFEVGEKTYYFDAGQFGRVNFPLFGKIKSATLKEWGYKLPGDELDVTTLELECSIKDKPDYPNHLDVVQ